MAVVPSHAVLSKHETAVLVMLRFCLQHIPGWWIGAYYMNPVAWSLHGLIASNVGDYDARVVQLAAGGQQSVPDFLLEQYGYRHDWIGWVVVVLAAFVVLFWGMGAVAFKVLHFRH